MLFSKENEQLSLLISIPFGMDTIRVIGKPHFLNIQEIEQGSQRKLEVTCCNPQYFSSFEAFCDLVELNVRNKHLPALSVFLNVLRVWNWEQLRKIA